MGRGAIFSCTASSSSCIPRSGDFVVETAALVRDLRFRVVELDEVSGALFAGHLLEVVTAVSASTGKMPTVLHQYDMAGGGRRRSLLQAGSSSWTVLNTSAAGYMPDAQVTAFAVRFEEGSVGALSGYDAAFVGVVARVVEDVLHPVTVVEISAVSSSFFALVTTTTPTPTTTPAPGGGGGGGGGGGDDDDEDDDGLAQGTIAVIVIGSVLGAGLLGVVVYFVFTTGSLDGAQGVLPSRFMRGGFVSPASQRLPAAAWDEGAVYRPLQFQQQQVQQQ